tara:strand:+ start:86 stop:274 length:189 start_codon:yes stop_codon:yes gene_type:complete
VYHLTKEVILDLLNKEIKKTNGIATLLYKQELLEIKQDFLDCLDEYDIKMKDMPLVCEEDLI